MTRYFLVTVDSTVSRVTKQQPLFRLNNVPIYYLNDGLLDDIKVQITTAINEPATYTTVGYIEDGKVNINSGKELEIDLYKFRQFMFKD